MFGSVNEMIDLYPKISYHVLKSVFSSLVGLTIFIQFIFLNTNFCFTFYVQLYTPPINDASRSLFLLILNNGYFIRKVK